MFSQQLFQILFLTASRSQEGEDSIILIFQGRGCYLKGKIISSSVILELSSDTDFSKESLYPKLLLSTIGKNAPFSKVGIIN